MGNKLLKFVGFDPSLRNWGVSIGTFDPEVGIESLNITELDVIQPVLPTGKQVRQNSVDLEAASQLAERAYQYAKDANAVFVEVPVGSQSARAMASYGICVGVLGTLRSHGIAFVEVTPTEVKLSAVGNKTATKKEMIEWATKAHPEAPWSYYKDKGLLVISEAKAEHMADATAAIYAGVKSQSFQQMLKYIK